MATYKAVVRLAASSGVAKDEAMNTFHVFWAGAGSPATADFNHLRDDLALFYNTVDTGTLPVKDYLNQDRDHTTNHCHVDAYLIPSTPGILGSPVYSGTWTLTAPTTPGVPLPDQVAVGLSYHGDLTGLLEESGTTRPKARKRGRLFIGPLNAKVMEETSGGVVAPNTVSHQAMVDIGAAAKATVARLLTHSWEWIVFSRAGWTQVAVVGGWVDDRFDTQRRRLEPADSRVVWVP